MHITHTLKNGSNHGMPCPSIDITSRQKYVGAQRKFLYNTNTHAVHSEVALECSVAWSKSYKFFFYPLDPCYTGHVYTSKTFDAPGIEVKAEAIPAHISKL